MEFPARAILVSTYCFVAACAGAIGSPANITSPLKLPPADVMARESTSSTYCLVAACAGAVGLPAKTSAPVNYPRYV